MVGGGPRIAERRRHRRSQIQVPVQFSDRSGTRTLAAGHTVNLCPGGLLAECRDGAPFAVNQPVSVHVGVPPELWQEADGRFHGWVRRVERGARTRCAIEAEGGGPPFLQVPDLVGKHPSMVEVKRKLADLADCPAGVLIRGESGTGKSVAAKLIHEHSSRSGRPFVRQNCPSIPATLMESQFFGHEKGAFTDAKSPRPGVFRLAHRGTLVLEEISTLPCDLQAKLLQAIEEKRFFPVGGLREVQVDVRIIATTNDDLEAMMRRGTFRDDLFYRLNELSLTLPTLRDRKDDVPLLADSFLRKYSSAFGKQYRPLDRVEIGMLVAHPWPGNVRELENVIKRSVLTGRLDLPIAGVPEAAIAIRAPNPHLAASARALRRLRTQLATVERQAIVHALDAAEHNKTRAAAALGISYRTLLRKLKRYQIGG